MLSTLAKELTNLLFPIHCVGCETPATYCCPVCLEKLPPAPASPDRTILALFNYRDERVKKLIWLLKYRGGREVAKILAGALYDRVLDDMVEIEMFHPTRRWDGQADETWLVIPIPLSRQKRRQRGFNQTEEIAKHLLRRNSRNFERGFDLLRRVRNNRSQMSIRERAERWVNIEDAFQVADPSTITGRNILLIDDVTTTGATLSEARRVLHQAGARHILAVAVAHG